MTELFEFIKTYKTDYYSHHEAIFTAHEMGLIKQFELVDGVDLEERRWGVNRQYVYKIDGKLIAIEVYVMHNDDADDLFEDVYEVEPYQITVTKYKKVNND